MRKITSRQMNKKLLWIPILILAAGGLITANITRAGGKGGQDIEQAVGQFYSALNAMFTGDLGPMKEVWSHADDVTYMGPTGGFQVGWDQVLKNWEEQAAMKLGGKVEPTQMRITVGQDLAIVSDVETGENTNVAGKAEKIFIRATNLFRKEHGKWKMIGHHTDLVPSLAK
jgi:ketosteroid isomerase-like protein